MDAIQFPWELARNMRLVAVVLDRRAQIEYCNQYFLDLVGWRSDEVLHRDWFDLFIQHDVQEIRELFNDILEEKDAALHHENDIRTKSGQLRCVRWNNTVVRAPDNSITGVASIGEDITTNRSLEREVLEAGSRERHKLAVELHDGLGQELFGLALLAESMAATAKKKGLSTAADLSRLNTIARDATEDCRRMAHGLSPLGRVQGGLVEAFRQMTTMPSNWQGPTIQYDAISTSPLRLPLEAVEHIYRIGQEVFGNAIKHSSAKSITVRIEIHPSSIRLEVEDNGIGPKKMNEQNGGLGLELMRYRSNLIRAKFRVLATRPHGTRVVCETRQ